MAKNYIRTSRALASKASSLMLKSASRKTRQVAASDLVNRKKNTKGR